jgi:hypothetical protein
METLIVGCLSVLLQCIWKARKQRQAIKVAFNVASTAVSITLSYAFIFYARRWLPGLQAPLLVALTGVVYFGINTGSIAAVIALTENKLRRVGDKASAGRLEARAKVILESVWNDGLFTVDIGALRRGK